MENLPALEALGLLGCELLLLAMQSRATVGVVNA